MKSGFRKRLFRLFLFFSLLPALAIALLGYLISSETTSLLDEGPDRGVAVARQLHQQFEASLDSGLTAWRLEGVRASEHVDLAVTFAADSLTLTSSSFTEDSSKPLISRITELSSESWRGSFELEGALVQYACEVTKDSTYCVAIRHNPAYTELLEATQEGTAVSGVRRDILATYVLFVGILLAAIVLVTGLVALYFSRRMASGLARPVVELSTAAEDIAKGRFGTTVEVEAWGELAVLVDSFNKMSTELKSATDRLAQTERVAAWRNVARRFAHELKNPLQPIIVSMYRIQKMAANSELGSAMEEPLRAASEELQQLQALAERFSKLAKLPEPKPQEIDLTEFLRSISNLYEEQMTHREFVTNLPSQPTVVTIDETYFREVMHNLLKNALEATSEGDRISVGLKVLPATLELSVEDGGKGMTAQELETSRLPSFTTKREGSGLGLAVVEKVVTECNGTLKIQSEPDHGTRITIELPRKETSE